MVPRNRRVAKTAITRWYETVGSHLPTVRKPGASGIEKEMHASPRFEPNHMDTSIFMPVGISIDIDIDIAYETSILTTVQTSTVKFPNRDTYLVYRTPVSHVSCLCTRYIRMYVPGTK